MKGHGPVTLKTYVEITEAFKWDNIFTAAYLIYLIIKQLIKSTSSEDN